MGRVFSVSLIIPSKPQFIGSAGDSSSGHLLWVQPAEFKTWNDGDILTTFTAGTIDFPTPNGSLATLIGPVLGFNLTTGLAVLAGAPAQDYYGVASYTGAAGIESLPSLPFIISAPYGFIPTVSVSAVGAPVGATDFYVYLGTIPDNYYRQNIGAGTALGATFTATNPLTNYTGVARAPAGTSTGLVGMANEPQQTFFAGFPGGSASAGPRSLFGASQSMAPGWDNDGFKSPALSLNPDWGTFVMNLLQPYYPGMDYSLQVGINIDTTNLFVPAGGPIGGTGFYVMDSTQTACATLIRRVEQFPAVELNGDIGARCEFRFYYSALVA
jgi:hypothetical protein